MTSTRKTKKWVGKSSLDFIHNFIELACIDVHQLISFSENLKINVIERKRCY